MCGGLMSNTEQASGGPSAQVFMFPFSGCRTTWQQSLCRDQNANLTAAFLCGSSCSFLLHLMRSHRTLNNTKKRIRWSWGGMIERGKRHSVTTHAHSEWLHPASAVCLQGPSYRAGSFSTFNSLLLNPFRGLRYMSTVAHCSHQRLCVCLCVLRLVLAESSLQSKKKMLILLNHLAEDWGLLLILFTQFICFGEKVKPSEEKSRHLTRRIFFLPTEGMELHLIRLVWITLKVKVKEMIG